MVKNYALLLWSVVLYIGYWRSNDWRDVSDRIKEIILIIRYSTGAFIENPLQCRTYRNILNKKCRAIGYGFSNTRNPAHR